MSTRIEWRTKAEGDDSLLEVDDGTNTVVHAWQAEPLLLTDFLNDMRNLDKTGRGGIEVSQRDPADWGGLVIARSETGDVLSVDPERYWGGVAYWFRSRGGDPHLWHVRH